MDTERHGQQQIVRVLRARGCECCVVGPDDSPVQTAVGMRPDAVVLDSCAGATAGVEVLRALKADHRTALIPVICVAGGRQAQAVSGLLRDGADDFVAKPFDADELLARIEAAARRRVLLGGVSPLTDLPGNALLTRELEQRLRDDREFAFLHVDLDGFKAYNDRYGFIRGDHVIAATAQLLHAQVDRHDPAAVLAHIGGDDFGVITTLAAARPLADGFAAAFDELALELSRDQQRDPEAMPPGDRRSGRPQVPTMSVSIGMVLWTRERPRSVEVVADAAAEMKATAKAHLGSYVAVDRRRA